jgi:hypothetical protein
LALSSEDITHKYQITDERLLLNYLLKKWDRLSEVIDKRRDFINKLMKDRVCRKMDECEPAQNFTVM